MDYEFLFQRRPDGWRYEEVRQLLREGRDIDLFEAVDKRELTSKQVQGLFEGFPNLRDRERTRSSERARARIEELKQQVLYDTAMLDPSGLGLGNSQAVFLQLCMYSDRDCRVFWRHTVFDALLRFCPDVFSVHGVGINYFPSREVRGSTLGTYSLFIPDWDWRLQIGKLTKLAYEYPYLNESELGREYGVPSSVIQGNSRISWERIVIRDPAGFEQATKECLRCNPHDRSNSFSRLIAEAYQREVSH